MTEWVVNAEVKSATISSDNWVKVLWLTKIDNKEEYISSNFGPDYGLREIFFDRTGVGPKNISSLEGKVLGVRIYKSGRGKLMVSPADIFDPKKAKTPQPAPLTHQPLATFLSKTAVPAPNAPQEVFKKTVAEAKANPMVELQKVVAPTKPAVAATVVKPALVSSPAPTTTKVPNPSDPQVKRLDTVALKDLLKVCNTFLQRNSITARMIDKNLATQVEAMQQAVAMEIANRMCK